MIFMVGATTGAKEPTSPGPGLLGLGNLRRLRADPIAFLMSLAQSGDVVPFRLGVRRVCLLRDPEHIKLVLQERNTRYDRKTRARQAMGLALGQGLLTSEGEFWRRQRRTMQPAFHRERIAHFAAVMASETEAMLGRWRGPEKDGQALDVAQEMMRLTLSIVGKTLFSTDISGEADAVGRAVTEIQQYVSDRMLGFLGLPTFIPTPRNRRFREALRAMDQIIYEKLMERRRTGDDPHDLLSMLMDVRDGETGEGMTDRQLRDEAITMISAGHETTANALAWTWYLLSKHPAVLRRLREELDAVLGGRTPTADDLSRLSYTGLVVKESMRLYPPVWLVARRVAERDEIGGHTLSPGTIVLCSPYVTHHHPGLFPNPEGFEPERFAPERSADLPRFAYFPFGGGPRQCIGNNFAMMEAQLIVAMVAQRYDLHLQAGHPVEFEPLITLRPRHGMKMTLRAR